MQQTDALFSSLSIRPAQYYIVVVTCSFLTKGKAEREKKRHNNNKSWATHNTQYFRNYIYNIKTVAHILSLYILFHRRIAGGGRCSRGQNLRQRQF